MTDHASTYLARAAECERRAARAREDEIHSTFSDLADHWRYIAREVENLVRLRRELNIPRLAEQPAPHWNSRT
jgi:hypothetical protein